MTKYIFGLNEHKHMKTGRTCCKTGAVEYVSFDSIKAEKEVLDIPAILFQPHRFLILGDLWKHDEASYKELLNALNTSEGNLSSHLRSLENKNIIESRKEIYNKRVNTFYRLTPKGKTEFSKLIDILNRQIKIFKDDNNA